MSQVPGLGHVTFYRHPGRYPTLFHSPLVGVDKETLATSTLRFPREVRRRNENLGNLFSRSRSRSLGSRSRQFPYLGSLLFDNSRTFLARCS